MFVNVLLPGTTPIPLYTCSIFTCQIIKLGGSKFLECSCSSANMNCMYRKYFIQVLKVLVLSAYKFNKAVIYCQHVFYNFIIFDRKSIKENKLYVRQSLNSYPLNVIIYFLLGTLGLTGYFFHLCTSWQIYYHLPLRKVPYDIICLQF